MIFIRLIKEENEEIGFMEDHLIGPWIKKQLAEGDTDGDGKVSSRRVFAEIYRHEDRQTDGRPESGRESR